MSQVSLLSFLFPVEVFTNNLHHLCLCLKQAQLEALHKEQVLKLHLDKEQFQAVYLS